MPNREELRQKGGIGVKKTTCHERGKMSFSERGEINMVFRPQYF
jgi:hypothetical protein